MKNILGILVLTVLTCPIVFGQNVITVSSSAGFPADYTDLQAAIDNASDGDVILVHGGIYQFFNGTSHAYTINKRLQIYGTGYFLTENPETQNSPIPATLQSAVIFEAGSERSIISGFIFGVAYGIYINANNINVSKCYFKGGWILANNNGNNALIQQNYIKGNIRDSNTGGSGLILKNNWIESDIENIKSSVVENNIVVGSSSNCTDFPENTIFNNNIFTAANPIIDCPSNGNIFNHNLFVTDNSNLLNLPGANNQINIPQADLFLGAGIGISTDGQWMLKENSPAIGAGLNGVDCGIFGGDLPYILSGIPAGPHIYEMTVDPVGTSSGGLNVQIKAKIKN